MNSPVDPELEAMAAQYFDALKQSYLAANHSRAILSRINSQFGRAAADAAMAPLFEGEREQIKLLEWDRILKFYAEHGLAPLLEHPDMSAGPAPDFDFFALGQISDPKQVLTYCTARAQSLGEAGGRHSFKMRDGNILKVAINPEGIERNNRESRYILSNYPGVVNFPVAAHSDSRWIVNKPVLPVSSEEVCEYYGFTRDEMFEVLEKFKRREWEEKFDDSNIDNLWFVFKALGMRCLFLPGSFGRNPDSFEILLTDYGSSVITVPTVDSLLSHISSLGLFEERVKYCQQHLTEIKAVGGRHYFDLGDGSELRVASDFSGWDRNCQEAGSNIGFYPEVANAATERDSGANWVVCKRLAPASAEEVCQYYGLNLAQMQGVISQSEKWRYSGRIFNNLERTPLEALETLVRVVKVEHIEFPGSFGKDPETGRILLREFGRALKRSPQISNEQSPSP